MSPSESAGPRTGTSEAVTRGIRVSVEAVYSPPHSRPSQQQWFFVYTIRIANEGDEAVQLVSRHWIITDAVGSVEHVRGLGVVGEQPVLEPGEAFEYSSGCPLTTPSGDMSRDVSDGDRRRRHVRRGDRALPAGSALHDPLKRGCRPRAAPRRAQRRE